jgi:hypothetical protein
VAGILATPLFFVALMAFTLLLDKPSTEIAADGSEVLANPSGSVIATIYLLSFAVSACVVLTGGIALLLPSRIAVFVPCVVAIVVTATLLVPLDGWEAEHTARYPVGVDLIPKSDPSDLILRGEWEENARRTAEQIGMWTIVMASVAIALTVALRIRRRRRNVPPPSSPEAITAESRMVRRGLGRPWG